MDSARVAPGATIPNGGRNITGVALRVPGGTQTFYPAFWIRDAAMMLGGDLVPADEVKGWVRVVAATQPGLSGLSFAHGLRIPAYSIPDHITLDGRACWFPGAYTEQGTGQYGHLPPADDAFFFIQMVDEVFRLTRDKKWLQSSISTEWGDHPTIEVADRAFESVAVDPATGLVVCDTEEANNRVDWGFCDSIRKAGSCLMPSLLRWQAAGRLAKLWDAAGDRSRGDRYRAVSRQIAVNVSATFFRSVSPTEGLLLSATGLGRKDDVWASAFAVWLRVLPKDIERMLAMHLLALCRAGGTVMEGQVRQNPPTGEFGGHWESSTSELQDYQTGGYWATPTGWFVTALKRVDKRAADRMLAEYVAYVKANRAKGAPFEWINPKTGVTSNGNYGSSAGLGYVSMTRHP